MSGWRLHNCCWVTTCAPHETVDVTKILDSSIWKEGGLFARWTSNFDCQEETGWYFIIKDKPFEMSQINGNARNRLRKGLKNFIVKEIKSSEYVDEICKVYKEAWSQYPVQTRPDMDQVTLCRAIKRNTYRMVGAFSIDDGRLCGFATFVKECGSYYAFSELKAIPAMERLNINAALVHGRLEAIKEDLAKGIYGCSGEKNILHETAYQDYLVEKFAFRKVNCHLHMAYNPKIKWVIMFLYPFRRLFGWWNVRILNQVYAVLCMEEIARKCKRLRGE